MGIPALELCSRGRSVSLGWMAESTCLRPLFGLARVQACPRKAALVQKWTQHRSTTGQCPQGGAAFTISVMPSEPEG